MRKEEILNAFIQAENDWSQPVERAIENHTHLGLCYYFRHKLNLRYYLIICCLAPLWMKYRTSDELFEFYKLGADPQGRAERLEAIRKVIEDLKKEL